MIIEQDGIKRELDTSKPFSLCISPEEARRLRHQLAPQTTPSPMRYDWITIWPGDVDSRPTARPLKWTEDGPRPAAAGAVGAGYPPRPQNHVDLEILGAQATAARRAEREQLRQRMLAEGFVHRYEVDDGIVAPADVEGWRWNDTRNGWVRR